ncbi:hypothetical protein [Varibaculum massiliense]|uniref:hypothetical protein n=1 Tax=Varibaculum massiliense TaxID=1852372 RepID=UPI00288BB2CF|nr:hypothetical protein [Varibaculum massiliense]
MNLSNNRLWRRGCTAALLIGIIGIVTLGFIGHPVFASRMFSLMLLILGVYRLLDRSPNAWCAVRSWWLDCLALFTLSIMLFILAPYGGMIMPTGI